MKQGLNSTDTQKSNTNHRWVFLYLLFYVREMEIRQTFKWNLKQNSEMNHKINILHYQRSHNDWELKCRYYLEGQLISGYFHMKKHFIYFIWIDLHWQEKGFRPFFLI